MDTSTSDFCSEMKINEFFEGKKNRRKTVRNILFTIANKNINRQSLSSLNEELNIKSKN